MITYITFNYFLTYLTIKIFLQMIVSQFHIILDQNFILGQSIIISGLVARKNYFKSFLPRKPTMIKIQYVIIKEISS